MESNSFLHRPFDDIIFEHRNKAYGAYALRCQYGTRMKIGLAIGISAFVLTIAAPLVAYNMTSNVEPLTMKTVELTDINTKKDDIKKPTLPPPPPKHVEKKIATVKFKPPRVLEDEQVPREEIIVPLNSDAAISDKTQEGEKATNLPPSVVAAPSLPPPPKEVVEKPAEEKEFIIVEENPMFPDGELAMMRFLAKNIQYPTLARENGIQGKVFVQFTVNSEGFIKNAQVLRGISGGCNEEALRVVQLMPRWKPGRQQGRAVNVRYVLPINFQLR